MDRPFEDLKAQAELAHWPVKLRAGRSGVPEMLVTYKGLQKVLRVEEVVAAMLSNMKDLASRYLADRGQGELGGAVITVPACSSLARRQVRLSIPCSHDTFHGVRVCQ